MSSLKILAVSVVCVWLFLFMLSAHIITLYKQNKMLSKRIDDLSKELKEIKGYILAPTIPPAGFDASMYTPQPGFVIQEAGHQPPPPNFGFPPIDPNQFRAQGQTNPIDNQLPLRGTAK